MGQDNTDYQVSKRGYRNMKNYQSNIYETSPSSSIISKHYNEMNPENSDDPYPLPSLASNYRGNRYPAVLEYNNGKNDNNV